MDTLLTRRLMMMAGGSPVPPTPTMIPYIRGGAGGSYIDTGITPDETTRVIVWARNFNPGVNYTWFFGSREAGMTEQFGVYSCITQNTGKIGGLYASEFFYTGDAFSLMSGYHKYELNGNVFSVDGTVVATASSATITNTKNIYLFGLNSDGNLNSPVVPIDICACKIYKGGVLVRDFTPVNSPSIGLYDAVSDTVFTNAGNGSFTYETFAPNAYVPLEYISCTGEQYFDSGVKGSKEVPIVCCLIATGAESRYYIPVMSLISTSSGRCGFAFANNSAVVNGRLQGALNTSSGFAYRSTTSLTNQKIVVVKNSNVFTFYKNNAKLGEYTGSTATFSNGLNMFVGANNNNGTAHMPQAFVGRFYFLAFGAQKNFVPAKVNGVAGMYDTYNDVFYSSVSGTNFVAGPEL